MANIMIARANEFTRMTNNYITVTGLRILERPPQPEYIERHAWTVMENDL